jgi:hypothetical protein
MRKSQSRTSKAVACDQENVLIETLKGMGANGGRPSGTLVVTVLYPALKRGANLGRPSGAGSRATPFYLGWLRVIFHTLNVQPNRAHTEKFCGIRGRIVWRTAKLRNVL